MHLALGLVLFFSLISVTRAEDVYTVIVKKQKAKQKDRWTLLDWMLLKETIALQDQWLALHKSSTLFELYLGADISEQRVRADTNAALMRHDLGRGHLGFFIGPVGLEGSFERGEDDYKQLLGLLNLRLFGRSAQSTYLNLQGGWRRLEESTTNYEFTNSFAGAAINLYVIDILGLEGLYRNYFEGKDEAANLRVRGRRWEAGGFLEFGFLRLYLTWFKEMLDMDVTGQALREQARQGLLAGARLYF